MRDLQFGEQGFELYSGACACPNACRDVVNLLVIGQTGAGKTTLIDSFANFVLGIEMYDNFRYKIVDESQINKNRIAMLKEKYGAENVNEAAVQQTSLTNQVNIYHIPA